MNYDIEENEVFGRSVMAGLFAGIIVTIANLIFDLLYRDVTRFNPSQIVNVTSIIFTSIIFSVVAGIVYYLIVAYVNKRGILYTAIFIALTVLVTFVAFTIQRSPDPRVSAQFHGLFAGVVIITGLVDAFLIPYLAKHKNVAF